MLPLAKRNLALLTETPFMKKVKGGAIITEIVDNMIKKRSRILAPERSIFIYSAHDVTLVNLMRALNVISQTSKKPDYSATFVVELHHSVIYENDFEVKIVYYYDSEDKFPKELTIDGCEEPCSLTNFVKSIDAVILRNYDDICKTF